MRQQVGDIFKRLDISPDKGKSNLSYWLKTFYFTSQFRYVYKASAKITFNVNRAMIENLVRKLWRHVNLYNLVVIKESRNSRPGKFKLTIFQVNYIPIAKTIK